ncbi:MAG: hypothetical protein L0216_08085 [Planctomycetales bacterium]|nr:hypothetical protein [Planctomycetales bacterium]
MIYKVRIPGGTLRAAAALLAASACFADESPAPGGPGAGDGPAIATGVPAKRQVEEHYAQKIQRLLGPCFRQPPAVSVDVELDLEAVTRATRTTETSGATETTETIVRTPGAVRRRSVAVALPAEEVGAEGLAPYRKLLERGLSLAEGELELMVLPLRPPELPRPPAAPTLSERVLGLLARHGGDLVWAGAVVLVAGVAGFAGLRALARHSRAAPAPVATPAPVAWVPARPAGEAVFAAAPLAPAPPIPAAAAAPGPRAPAVVEEPLHEMRRLAEEDPARAAEVLRELIEA